MPPGDPDGEYSESPTTSNRAQQEIEDDGYIPGFTLDDWFVSRIFDYDDFCEDIEEVYEAVRFWKQIADDLRSNGYPLYERVGDNFDPSLRNRAYMLHDFLDMLINKKSLTTQELYQKLRFLIAQGDTYSDFKTKMSNLDVSTKCNQIWENEAVAYRCNTCALSPCMSLCESCFEENGHKGHDFTRFFSREGGACDCGNDDVIKPQGFCSRHGPKISKPETNFLDFSLPEFIITKLITRLFLEWRGWVIRAEAAKNDQSTTGAAVPFNTDHHAEKEMRNVKFLIEFLQEIVNYGGPMREATARILLDRRLYQALTEKKSSDVKANERVEVTLDWRSMAYFREDKKTLLLPEDVMELFPLVNKDTSLECHNLLHELIIWIIRQNFPQNLINFSLSMLSEVDYRDEFALRFFTWYPFVGKVIRELCTYQKDLYRYIGDRVQGACSRVIHISVQMLSSSTLCHLLNERCDLVNTVCNVTMYLLCEKVKLSELTIHPAYVFCLTPDLLKSHYQSTWNVMLIENNASITQHGYWFVMGDMQNLLSHAIVAIAVILNENTFEKTYMSMLSRMQGMNQMWRVVFGEHRELDYPESVQKAYTLEFETLAVTLFNMVSAVISQDHAPAAVKFFDTILRTLDSWFDELRGINDESDESSSAEPYRCQPYVVSFHIPLHRHISTALSHFNNISGFNAHLKKTLLVDESKIRLLILHPLRIQVARCEINCGMWVRNGGEARILSLIYAQWNVNNAFQTPDLDLIRYCAAHMDKDFLMKLLLANYYLDERINFIESDIGKPASIRRKLFTGVQHSEYPETRERSSQRFEALLQDDLDQIEYIIENLNEKSLPNSSVMSEEERQRHMRFIQHEDNMTIVRIMRVQPCSNIVAERAERDDDHLGLAMNHVSRTMFHGMGLVPDEPEPDPTDPFMFNSIPIFDRPSFNGEVLGSSKSFRLPVLVRSEWMDPMMMGLLKLIAEVVVIRVNSGATAEEHYKSEMVNCLANNNLPHSRLRGCISEKGSRGSETIDRVFDIILKEIATFTDPDELIAANSMPQGVFQLKEEIWDEQLCPVFCMMRANSQKQVADVFGKLCEKDKEMVKTKSLYSDVKVNEQFWVAFRLINFDKSLRHEGIANIYSLLITEKLMLTCLIALTEDDSYSKFHEITIQLAIYLLTLGVKYAQTLDCDQETKKYLIRMYHTPFKLKTSIDSNAGFAHHTIFSFIFTHFEREANVLDSYVPLLKKILDGSMDAERVYGGAAVYLARFFAILAKLSPTCRRIIEKKLENENLKKAKAAEESVISPSNAAKESMKKRMAQIMENSRKRNLATMEKLMEKEGMSKEEVDDIDTAKPDVCLYECPICGDSEMPNTLNKPFGMLVKLSTNFLAEEQIDATVYEYTNMLEMDSKRMELMADAQLVTRNHFATMRRDLAQWSPSQGHMFHPVTGMDLKTCGHTAHIECFNVYRQSLHGERGRSRDTREVGCPLCRFTVNSIFPLLIDFGFESTNRGPFDDPKLAFETWKDCLNTSKVFARTDDVEAYNKHYGSDIVSHGLFEILKSRNRTSDTTERKLADRNGTAASSLVAMAVASVERSSILRCLEIPERRKNTRHLLTKHILSAAAIRSERVDTFGSFTVMTDLVYRSVPGWNDVGNEGPSRMATDGDDVDRDEDEEMEGLDNDELSALRGSTSMERTQRDTMLDLSFEHIERICKDRAPTLAYDPKAMFTRVVAFVIDKWSLSKQDKSNLCTNLLKHFIEGVIVRAVIRLMLRIETNQIQAILDGSCVIEELPESVKHVPKLITECLNAKPHILADLLTALYSQEEIDFITNNEFSFILQSHVVDFVRFASELFYHLDIVPPEINNLVHQNDFGFEKALKLVEIDSQKLCRSVDMIRIWSTHFQPLVVWSLLHVAKLPLVREALAWKPRQLLQLPDEYDDLFNRYFHRECSTCSKVPSNPLVCLLCSRLICLDECCKILPNRAGEYDSPSISEVEYHAEECSSSSGVLLSLNSSLIIVVRGKQAGIWGSVYLDSHGEEDRNLRRGKPLKLSKKRFECLKNDWLEQEWLRVRNWGQLSSSLLITQIREAHNTYH